MNLKIQARQIIPAVVNVKQYSNNTYVLQYTLDSDSYDTVDLTELDAYAITSINGLIDETQLTKSFDDQGHMVLTWNVMSFSTVQIGHVEYQIMFKDSGGVVWYSLKAIMLVSETIDADDHIVANYPSLLRQWEDWMVGVQDEVYQYLIDYSAGVFKQVFTADSGWVAGGIGYKLTLDATNRNLLHVWRENTDGSFEQVVTGITYANDQIIIEALTPFKGFIMIATLNDHTVTAEVQEMYERSFENATIAANARRDIETVAGTNYQQIAEAVTNIDQKVATTTTNANSAEQNANVAIQSASEAQRYRNEAAEIVTPDGLAKLVAQNSDDIDDLESILVYHSIESIQPSKKLSNTVYSLDFKNGTTLNGYVTYEQSVVEGEKYYITTSVPNNPKFAVVLMFDENENYVDGVYFNDSGSLLSVTDYEIVIPNGVSIIRTSQQSSLTYVLKKSIKNLFDPKEYTDDQIDIVKNDLILFEEDISEEKLIKEIEPIDTISGYRVTVSLSYNNVWKAVDADREINIYRVKKGKRYKAYGFGYDANPSFYIGALTDKNIKTEITAPRLIQYLLCGGSEYPKDFTYHYVEFVADEDGYFCLTSKNNVEPSKLYGRMFVVKQQENITLAVIKNNDEYNCLSLEYGNVYKSRVYKHCNANNLFQLYHLGYGVFDGTSYVENTSVMTAYTDIVGPASIGRWNASSGSENGVWTGGNHSVTKNGVICKTAEETYFNARCGGIDITNAPNGVYYGKAVFNAENDLYFGQTITENSFNGATKALHEKRQYIVDDDMKVKVSLEVLYNNVSFSVYYGMQNILNNVVDNVENPAMLTKYSDMNARVLFNKESKVFYLNRNDGWHLDMILDDVGIANREQLRMDEAYFSQYGYGNISNGKIYQCLIQGKNYGVGTLLMWSGTYKFYYA